VTTVAVQTLARAVISVAKTDPERAGRNGRVVSKNRAYGKNRTKKYCWLTFPQNGTRNKPGAHSSASECSQRRRDSPNCEQAAHPCPGRADSNSLQMLRVIELSTKTHQPGKSL